MVDRAPLGSAKAILSPSWLFAAAVAFAANLFLHLPLTEMCDAAAERLGWFVYNRLLTVAFLSFGVASLIVIMRRAARPMARPAALVLMMLTVFAQQFLVVGSIEDIHYPQYALLAMLLGRAGLPAEASWIGATVLGVVDEGYQYLVLRHGRPEYLDWNDIVLNAIGAGFGVVALLSLSDARPERPLCTVRFAAMIVALCLAAALVLAPPQFSSFFAVTAMGRRYHVLAASEGVAIIGALWLGARCFLVP